MEENKNLSSNDELMDDSMDAVAGGKSGQGWTRKQKKEVRNFCNYFENPEEKFKEFTTNYTYDQFQEKLKEAWGGFKY